MSKLFSRITTPSKIEASTMNSLRNMDLNADSQQNPPNLLGLPSEITRDIFQHLPPSSLLALQRCHSKLAPAARAILYEAPHFASTFHLAQFTHTITQNSQYGTLVHKIDLSGLPDVGKHARAEELLETWHRKCRREKERRAIADAKKKEQGEEERRLYADFDAGVTSASNPWVLLHTVATVPAHIEAIRRRESDPRFTDLSAPWHQQLQSDKPLTKSGLSPTSKDPNANHFYYAVLQQAIKIPIGLLFHILTKCSNLQVLNVKDVVFDTDYQIQDYLRDCNFSQHEWDYLLTFHPTTRSVRKDRDDAEIKAIHEQDLVTLIMELQVLKSLNINGCNWMPVVQKAQLCERGAVFEK